MTSTTTKIFVTTLAIIFLVGRLYYFRHKIHTQTTFNKLVSSGTGQIQSDSNARCSLSSFDVSVSWNRNGVALVGAMTLVARPGLLCQLSGNPYIVPVEDDGSSALPAVSYGFAESFQAPQTVHYPAIMVSQISWRSWCGAPSSKGDVSVKLALTANLGDARVVRVFGPSRPLCDDSSGANHSSTISTGPFRQVPVCHT